MENVILLIIFFLLLCVMAAVSIVLIRGAEKEKERALQEMATVKTDFLSRISNDIKTPMNVIMGATALGMEDTENPEKMQECLGRIQIAGNFLMELLNDLVDMSKIETGRFRLHARSYAFSDFLEEIQLMVEPACRKKRISFHMPEEEINVNLMVDANRFKQLFSNLLGNAVKFTQEGGMVALRVCNYATHNDSFSADYIIKDTGIGMSREFQKLLFEPFTQEHENVVEQQHGAGLGLAIARNIVDLMGGTIEIRSELGYGTEVKVHLDIPLAAVQPEKAGDRIGVDKCRQILSGKRVLLVEDHPLDVEITRHILEKQDMKVICAENGEIALDVFSSEKEHFFDVILMDLLMPEMDGLETTRRIRKIKHVDAQVIPIIAMSANDTPEDIEQCKEAGMNAHMAKPVDPRQLYQVLCEYLENPL